MSTSASSIVLPGDALGLCSSYDGGAGTYEREGSLYASRVGVRHSTAATSQGGLPLLRVVRPGGEAAELVTLEVGCIATARVGRVSQAMAHAEIVLVDGRPLPEPVGAVLRRENVRDSEIDKLDMLEAFRPGDLIRAAVVSLGDARSYYLSTAELTLGVVCALSEGGAPMAPLTAGTMHVPATGVVEKRKVAMVQQTEGGGGGPLG